MIFNKKKQINNKYNEISENISNMNYTINNILKEYTENIDEIMVIANNITIFSAFFCYYHRDEKSKNIIFQYIQNFLNFLSTTNISEEEIEDIKFYIINNKVIIEEKMIPNMMIEQIIDLLVEKTLINCCDLNYSKYSSMSVQLSNILLNFITLTIKQ